MFDNILAKEPNASNEINETKVTIYSKASSKFSLINFVGVLWWIRNFMVKSFENF